MTIYPKNFNHRFLNRDGYCSMCNSLIARRGPKVVTFVGKSGRQEIICPLCASELYNVFQQDEFINVLDK